MTEHIREQISALLDDELPRQEMDRTIEQLSDQPPLREAWERYHLISDLIRGDAQRRASPSFADRVRAQIDAEPPILAAPKPSRTPPAWVRPLAGGAVAASVAVLAVLAAPRFLAPEATHPSRVAVVKKPPEAVVYAKAPAPLASPAQSGSYQLVSGSRYQVQPVVTGRPAARWLTQYSGTHWKGLARPATESKLNKYLVDHSGYATQGPVGGVVPYATFVGYDARQ